MSSNDSSIEDSLPEVVEVQADVTHPAPRRNGLFKPHVNAIPGLFGCEHSGAFFFPQSNHNVIEGQMEELRKLQEDLEQKMKLLHTTVETKLAMLNKDGE